MVKYFGFFTALIVGAFLFVSSLALAAEKPPHMGEKEMGSEATITGQVVDPACYVSMGLQGESHKQCATACAKAGQAFGILDRKASVLYQVIEATPTTDPNKLLWDHVEQTVTVKGKIFEKDGMHVIVPEEVKGS